MRILCFFIRQGRGVPKNGYHPRTWRYFFAVIQTAVQSCSLPQISFFRPYRIHKVNTKPKAFAAYMLIRNIMPPQNAEKITYHPNRCAVRAQFTFIKINELKLSQQVPPDKQVAAVRYSRETSPWFLRCPPQIICDWPHISEYSCASAFRAAARARYLSFSVNCKAYAIQKKRRFEHNSMI